MSSNPRESESLPSRLREVIQEELDSEEKIVWLETPVPRYFTSESVLSLIFGLPMTVFGAWLLKDILSNELQKDALSIKIVFALFPVLILWIGMKLVTAPISIYRGALRTAYVITDRRAIVFKGGATVTIRSYPPEKLDGVYLKLHKNGSGDVILAFEHLEAPDYPGEIDDEFGIVEIGFHRVRNPREAQRLLRELVENSPSTAATKGPA